MAITTLEGVLKLGFVGFFWGGSNVKIFVLNGIKNVIVMVDSVTIATT